MFESTGIRCPVSADIEVALWTKLTINCAFNAVSALGHARYGRMAAHPDVRAVMEAAVGETVAVAGAGGVVLDPSEQVAGIWQIDALNGLVVRLGEARGIPTPVNRTLLALVKLREQDNAAEPAA
jgi:2-dehydropantoate 2-reductase